MDAIDRKLIDILQDDASLSYSALGTKVGLSVSAVNDRVRKLREQGVIKAYRLECHHMTGRFDFLLKLRLRDTSHLESFVTDTIKEVPGVVEVIPEIALSTAKETGFVPAMLDGDK